MVTDYEREVEGNWRWNFGIIAGVDGCWGVGYAFVSYLVILPAFLKQLGASPFAIGVLPAVFMLCMTGPQILVARLTRHLPIKKVFFTCTHYPGCLSLLLLSFLTGRLHQDHRLALIIATFVWLALYGLSISFAMPMWVNLMAKLFPASLRGRLFGYVFLLNNVCGTLGSLCAAKILAAYAFPRNFAILFLLGGVLLPGCVTSFLWLREPVRPVDSREVPRHFLRDLFEILKTSHDFRWCLIARFIGAFSWMAAGFYTVAGLVKFELGSASAGWFGAVLLASQMMGSLVGGRLGDRFGFKLVASLAFTFELGAAAMAIAAPGPTWYYLVFVMFGLRNALATIGMHNLSIEFSPTADKTTFVALASTCICPALVAGPIIGGLLAQHHGAGHDAVFTVAVACSAVAVLLMTFFVREPRRVVRSAGTG